MPKPKVCTAPNPHRPIVSLVYFAELTHPDTREGTDEDSLPSLSPLYFQLVAGNGPQARLVTEYAASVRRSVTVYHPDLDQQPDQYLRSLHDRFADLARGFPLVRFRKWRTPSTVEVDCRSDDTAFYAGRETGFTDFLNHVLDTCPATAKPTVIGDDAVTRFIAQGESRRSDNFASVSLGYVSLANRIVLAGSSCVSQGRPTADSDPDVQRPLNIFCAGLKGLYSPRNDRPAAWKAFGAELTAHNGNRRWTGERVGLAYDVAGLYVTAVIHNKRRGVPEAGRLDPNRAAVAQEFRELDCSNSQSAYCFKGVSGRVDFRAGRDGGNRPLAILTINDITAIDANPVCTFRFQDTAPCP